MDGPVECRSRRYLEREAALAGAAGAGDRDEADRRGSRRALDARERVGAADEAVMQRGKARRRERLERREVVAEAGRDELEELRRGRDVLQPMVSERSKRSRREAAPRLPCPASPA